MHVTRRSALILSLGGAALVGCGQTPPPQPPKPVAVAPAPVEPPSCERAAGGPTMTALGSQRISGAIALGKLGDKTLAYVADEDDHAVQVVDVDSGKQLARMDVKGRPSHVIILADGRVAVGVRDRSVVAILDPKDDTGAMTQRCEIKTAAEPVAMAITPDDATLLVSSGWGRALGAYDAKTLAKNYEVALPREPRAVVLSDDGKTAFVTQAVGGKITAVALSGDHATTRILLHGAEPDTDENGKKKGKLAQIAASFRSSRQEMMRQMAMSRASCQGFALAKATDPGGRLLAPQVLVDPGDVSQRPSGYGSDFDQTEMANVAVVDMSAKTPLSASIEKSNGMMMRAMRGESTDHHHEECLLPRAAAYDPETRSLFVTCLGIDAVIAYDAFAAAPARAEKRRWDVAAGPTGIAVDPAGKRAIVWSQFDRTVSRIPLAGSEMADEPSKVERIELATDPSRKMPMDVALGRLLFHEVGDERMSHDGRACASCHPDGRDDSLTWATPEGPRRSIMLAGRVEATAPYSWSGSEASLKEHLDLTFKRLHGAGGLKSIELDALAGYVDSLAAPVLLTATDPRIPRGKELFASAEVGCSGCHNGDAATDNHHHDVQSKTEQDKAGAFNTPSLRFVGGTGPYMHDGRYKTIHDLLLGMDGKMGKVGQLSDADLGALEAYVGAL